MGEEGILPLDAGRREYAGLASGEQRLHLALRLAHGGGGGDDLRGGPPGFAKTAAAQRVDDRLVEAHHRAEGAGDEMQFVLDHQVRRRQGLWQLGADARRLRGAVEAAFVVPIRAAEQLAGLRLPRQGRELVHGGDQKRRQALVDRLVHAQHGKRPFAAELAIEVRARDAQFGGLVVARQQREGFGLEPLAAPRAVLQGYGRRAGAWIRLELARLGAGGIRAVLAPSAHHVGRGGLAHP